jgi:hypothetical protein
MNYKRLLITAVIAGIIANLIVTALGSVLIWLALSIWFSVAYWKVFLTVLGIRVAIGLFTPVKDSE